MPGPGETRAAVVKLDPPESFSKGGVVIGFTSYFFYEIIC